MRVPIEYDPKSHEIRPVACTEALQEITGCPNLIVYRNRDHNTWVVALRSNNGRELIEVDFVTPDGSSPTPSRQDVKRIRDLFRPAKTIKQERAVLRQRAYQEQEEHCEQQAQYNEAIHSLARSIHRQYGAGASEAYLRGCGKPARIKVWSSA